MANIHIPKTWEIPEREVTPEDAFINRRRFLRTLAGAGLGIAGGSMLGYATESEAKKPELIDPNLMKFESVERNPAFMKVDRPITEELLPPSITISMNSAAQNQSGRRLRRCRPKIGK